MKENEPTLQEWRRLYDAAATVRRIAPWRWFYDTDLVAVVDPASGTTLYCSILGANDQVLGVAAYVGVEGLASFRRLLEGDSDEPSVENFFRQRMLTAFFEERSELDQLDLSIVKQLGFNATGDRPWPQFRSFHSGKPPGALDAAEARMLAIALDQICDVSIRVQNDATVIEDPDGERVLTRVPIVDADGEVSGWREEWRELDIEEANEAPPPAANVFDLRWAAIADNVIGSEGIWEAGTFALPAEVIEDPEGPFIAYASLIVDLETGHVFDLQATRQDEAHAALVESLARVIERLRQTPVSLHVESPEVATTLAGICSAFDIELVIVDHFTEFHEARTGLIEHLRNQHDVGNGEDAGMSDRPSPGPMPLEPLARTAGSSPLAGQRLAEIIERIDAFCAEHLDEEYAMLCRKTGIALADLDPSPLERGRIDIWACAITYAVGRANFLFDPSQHPHIKANELCRIFGVSPSSASAKSTAILEMLGIDRLDPHWTRQSLIDRSLLAWMIELEGIIVDARELPEEYQRTLHAEGLVPRPPWELLLKHLKERGEFTMLPSKDLVDALAEQKISIDPARPIRVVDADFPGDEAGILCAVEMPELPQALVVTIMILEPLPDDPLADDIRLYVERRLRSFEMVELLDRLADEREREEKKRRAATKRRKKKG